MAWTRSSFCSGGSCAEVDFQRASVCGSGSCVEVGHGTDVVLLRDSKDLTVPPLKFSPAAWSAFLEDVPELDRQLSLTAT